MPMRWFTKLLYLTVAPLGLVLLVGCGTMRERTATQQLLMSDAVDRAVSHIDFSPLSGEEIYLDTQYLNEAKSTSLVNNQYIISSLRQQMMAAGCYLMDKPEEAAYIVEARVGALGMDGHEINYGFPSNNVLNAAAVALPVPNSPLPAVPEISFGRKTEDSAAAKLAVFAYRRETREPVWQSGLSVARSKAQGKWILGAGPFQSGTIYEGTMFAGQRLRANPFDEEELTETEQEDNYRTVEIYDPSLEAKLNGTADRRRAPRLSRLPTTDRAGESGESREGSEASGPAESAPSSIAPPETDN